MAQARTVIGLDVHAQKIVAATVDVETGELKSFGLGVSERRLRITALTCWDDAPIEFAISLERAPGLPLR